LPELAERLVSVAAPAPDSGSFWRDVTHRALSLTTILRPLRLHQLSVVAQLGRGTTFCTVRRDASGTAFVRDAPACLSAKRLSSRLHQFHHLRCAVHEFQNDQLPMMDHNACKEYLVTSNGLAWGRSASDILRLARCPTQNPNLSTSNNTCEDIPPAPVMQLDEDRPRWVRGC
jgi:hypothetical protein